MVSKPKWKQVKLKKLIGKKIEGAEVHDDGHVYLVLKGKTYWLTAGRVYKWVGDD
jgi:hypothetical protein